MSGRDTPWRLAVAVGIGLALWLVVSNAWCRAMPGVRAASTWKIRIISTGAWSDSISGDETPDSCRQFRLTPSDVRRILMRSRPVSERAYAHELDASRCHATGTARTRGGRLLHWRIDAEGRVLLTAPGLPVSYRHDPVPAAVIPHAPTR